MNFKCIWKQTNKELNDFFYSPIAYIVIIIYLIVGGVFFWTVFFSQNQAELRGYFHMLPWILTFIIPAITMKLFAEEKNSGSYELLMTLPIRLEEIVIAKFLAALIFVMCFLVFIPIYGISVEMVGDLDWGPVIGGWVGAILLSSFYVSIGVFCSSLTNNQIVAFMTSLILCLFFFMVDKFFIFLPDTLVSFFNFFSSDKHFKSIGKGVIDSRDVLFFLLMSFIFILATHENLNKQFVNNRSSKKLGGKKA